MRWRKVVGVLLLVVLTSAGPSWGQFGSVVFDPSVFGEAVATVANTAKQVAQTAEMIDNQVKQLMYQARSVAALPMNLVQDIQGQISTYTGLLQQAQGMTFTVTNAAAQFEALYQAGGQSAAVLARMQAMLGQVRDAGRFAAEASAIFDRLCVQNTNLATALNASSAAVGETSAIQAQTQVLGVMADQQASLQQLLAAQARLETSWYTMQSTLADQAKRDSDRWFQNFGTTPPLPTGQTEGWVPPAMHY